MSGDRMPGGSTYCEMAVETLHIPKNLVTGSGGPVGTGTSVPLQLSLDSHSSGAAHKSSTDGLV